MSARTPSIRKKQVGPPWPFIRRGGLRGQLLERAYIELEKQFPCIKGQVVGAIEAARTKDGEHGHYIDTFVAGDAKTSEGLETWSKSDAIKEAFENLIMIEYTQLGCGSPCHEYCKELSRSVTVPYREPTSGNEVPSEKITFHPPYSIYLSAGVTANTARKLVPYWSREDLRSVTKESFYFRDPSNVQSYLRTMALSNEAAPHQ